MSNASVDNAATALLIEVANFNDGVGADNELGSYLRLGAVPSAIRSAYESLTSDDTVDDTALTNATGEDLARRVMGFVDDSRFRGDVDTDFYTNSNEEMQAESNYLHTKGGWRDHTDGNRVTTTRGDKVEVIGGNYKLLVLGREQWNNDAQGNDYGGGLHHESSGGITYHYDEVPGQIIDVRRTEDNGTWKVIEECDVGHFVARYHGKDKDWHAGGPQVTRIGSRGAYRVATEGADWGLVYNDYGFDDDRDDDFNKPNNASHLTGVAWPGDSTLPSVREEVFADAVIERTTATGTILDVDGTQDYPVAEHKDFVHAKLIHDIQTFWFYRQYMGHDSDFSVVATERWEGFFLEMFIAIATTMKLGAFADIRFGWWTHATNVALGIIQVNAVLKRDTFSWAIAAFIDNKAAPNGITTRLAATSYELDLNKSTVEATYTVKALSIKKN